MNMVISDASGNDLPLQINETMAFLDDNRDELARLRDAAGVEYLALDFGIVRRDIFVQCDYFPPKLVKLAAEFGLGIELSRYPPSEDEEMEKTKHADPDPHVVPILSVLGRYQADHPNARIDASRWNPAAVRIQTIDPDFLGQNWVERENRVWGILEILPEDVQTEISLLLWLTLEETKTFFANLEFENPAPSPL